MTEFTSLPHMETHFGMLPEGSRLCRRASKIMHLCSSCKAGQATPNATSRRGRCDWGTAHRTRARVTSRGALARDADSCGLKNKSKSRLRTPCSVSIPITRGIDLNASDQIVKPRREDTGTMRRFEIVSLARRVAKTRRTSVRRPIHREELKRARELASVERSRRTRPHVRRIRSKA